MGNLACSHVPRSEGLRQGLGEGPEGPGENTRIFFVAWERGPETGGRPSLPKMTRPSLPGPHRTPSTSGWTTYPHGLSHVFMLSTQRRGGGGEEWRNLGQVTAQVQGRAGRWLLRGLEFLAPRAPFRRGGQSSYQLTLSGTCPQLQRDQPG